MKITYWIIGFVFGTMAIAFIPKQEVEQNPIIEQTIPDELTNLINKEGKTIKLTVDRKGEKHRVKFNLEKMRFDGTLFNNNPIEDTRLAEYK